MIIVVTHSEITDSSTSSLFYCFLCQFRNPLILVFDMLFIAAHWYYSYSENCVECWCRLHAILPHVALMQVPVP